MGEREKSTAPFSVPGSGFSVRVQVLGSPFPVRLRGSAGRRHFSSGWPRPPSRRALRRSLAEASAEAEDRTRTGP